MTHRSSENRGAEAAPSRSGPGSEDAPQESLTEGHPPGASLRTFRARLYALFDKRADALFELTDAVLTAGHVASPPHLSLALVHRRGWGSLYAALAQGSFDEEALKHLLIHHSLAPDRTRDGPP